MHNAHIQIFHKKINFYIIFYFFTGIWKNEKQIEKHFFNEFSKSELFSKTLVLRWAVIGVKIGVGDRNLIFIQHCIGSYFLIIGE